MISIDEAIKFCHEKSENIKLKAEPQVFIDIAEWLEELKVYKECNISKTNFSMGYNKAIDDFMKIMEEWDSRVGFIRDECAFFTISNIREIAQQLKAGGIDGNERTNA